MPENNASTYSERWDSCEQRLSYGVALQLAIGNILAIAPTALALPFGSATHLPDSSRRCPRTYTLPTQAITEMSAHIKVNAKEHPIVGVTVYQRDRAVVQRRFPVKVKVRGSDEKG